jgi:hypothetical protein
MWRVFKRKLKKRFAHPTDADFAAIESYEHGWLENLQQLIGRSPLEFAWLADEIMDRPPVGVAKSGGTY